MGADGAEDHPGRFSPISQVAGDAERHSNFKTEEAAELPMSIIEKILCAVTQVSDFFVLKCGGGAAGVELCR